MAPDYEFYKGEFGGLLGEEDFNSLFPRAVRFVEWLIGYKHVSEAQAHCYKEAVCAVVESFSQNDPDGGAGFSIGSFRMDGSKEAGRKAAANAAIEILAPTGLLFGGV